MSESYLNLDGEIVIFFKVFFYLINQGLKLSKWNDHAILLCFSREFIKIFRFSLGLVAFIFLD